MRYADVDGDGRPDRVALRWLRFTRRSLGQGLARLTVRFADGRSASIRFQVPRWIDYGTNEAAMPPFGTAQVDGLRGRDIVVAIDNSPASFVFYTVIAARQHRLQTLPPPIRTGWFVGASVGPGGIGFACHGRVLTALESGPGHEVGHGDHGIHYRTLHTTFRWEVDHWQSLSRRTTRGHYEAGGWNCPGLAAFAF